MFLDKQFFLTSVHFHSQNLTFYRQGYRSTVVHPGGQDHPLRRADHGDGLDHVPGRYFHLLPRHLVHRQRQVRRNIVSEFTIAYYKVFSVSLLLFFHLQ